jgi:hypothetical protein
MLGALAGAMPCCTRSDVSVAPAVDAAGTVAAARTAGSTGGGPESTASSIAASAPPPAASVASDALPLGAHDWTGAYQYEECGGPSSLTPGGPAACWQYIIEIARPKAEAEWRAYIATDGYMTAERVAARAEEFGPELRLRFDPKPALPDDPPSTRQPGEQLLTLAVKGGETWIHFDSMRTDSGKRDAKLERLRPPPAQPGVAPKAMNQDPEGFACKSDADCILHRCNAKRGRCAYPCESDADCAGATRCGAPACIPVASRRSKKK